MTWGSDCLRPRPLMRAGMRDRGGLQFTRGCDTQPRPHDDLIAGPSPLAREQVKRHLHWSPSRQAVLDLGRHPQPRPRPGGIGVAADDQLALAFEDVDDRRSCRGVLRKLLAGGEGEEQELDVALVR